MPCFDIMHGSCQALVELNYSMNQILFHKNLLEVLSFFLSRNIDFMLVPKFRDRGEAG